MSQPVKVSDEVYAELKRRAAENSSTLQEALAAVLRQAASDVREMRKELAAAKRAAVTHEKRLRETDRVVEALREAVARVRQEAKRADEHVAKLDKDWLYTWEAIPDHEDTIEELRKRVSKLETTAHRHFGQTLNEEVKT